MKQFSDAIFLCSQAGGELFCSILEWLYSNGARGGFGMVSAAVLREGATFAEWSLRLILSAVDPCRLSLANQNLLTWPEAPRRTKPLFSPCIPASGARILETGPGRCCAWGAGQAGRAAWVTDYPCSLLILMV